MTEVVVEARGVTRRLPGPTPVTLVQDIDFAVGRGGFVAVTGPSGSGKSSLLYLLGLIDLPSAGTVLLEERDTSGLGTDDLAALRLAKIGFVFQFHFLLPEFTALANIMLPMRKLARHGEAEMRRRAERLLETLGLAEAAGKRPDQLSGGERQRVAIARAVANDPPLVLADEPTGNLDSASSRRVVELLGGLARQEGRAVVMVTHDLEMAARASRRIRLIDGRIVEDVFQAA